MSQIIEAVLGVAAVVVIFGVWDILKTLRAIQGELHLIRLSTFGSNRPSSLEE
jgi:hypothetical protein